MSWFHRDETQDEKTWKACLQRIDEEERERQRWEAERFLARLTWDDTRMLREMGIHPWR